MAKHPKWLRGAYDKWGGWVRKNNPSRKKLAEKAGWTQHKARVLIDFIKTMDAIAEVQDLDTEDEDHLVDEALEMEEEDESSIEDLYFNDKYIYDKENDFYLVFLKTAPQPVRLTGEKHRALVRAYSNWDGQPQTINQICRTYNFPRNILVEYLRVFGVTHDSEPFTKEEVMDRDVDDLVEEALQDRRQALYTKFESAKWNQIKKQATKWVEFEENTLLALTNSIQRSVPTYSVPQLDLTDSSSPYALVVSATDFHWGMYSWDPETGDGFDRKEAERRLHTHTKRILSRLPGRPEKIIVAVGSDWFHIDGQSHATTRGTPQDTDGSPTEILVTGAELTVKHIDMLAQAAPVEVVLMAGNHDRHNCFALLLYLDAWYKDQDHVTVVKDWKPRVYTSFGSTLIGFHHGDKTKTKDLGVCMAKEAREKWGQSKYHIFFGGHRHHHHVQEVGGIVHYQLPSLSGTDRWHAGEGYVTSDPALVAYMVDEETGISGFIQSTE